MYDAIGVYWGSEDSAHFNLPDMRDRVAAGASSTVALGTYQADATAVKGLSCKLRKDDRFIWAGQGWFSASYLSGDSHGFYNHQIASGQGLPGFIGASTDPTGANDLPLLLSSTDSETRMKNSRVNFIIKY